MKEVLRITVPDFVEIFLNKEKLAIVVLGTKSCMHTKWLGEVLPKIADVVTNLEVKFYFIIISESNIEEIENLKKKFKVESYPAVIFYKDGKRTDCKIPVDEKEIEIEEMLREVLT